MFCIWDDRKDILYMYMYILLGDQIYGNITFLSGTQVIIMETEYYMTY